MNSNLFDRLNAGGSFLENIYNQEELEKQAKKQAIDQVKALGGLAHQQITQAIGESGVEAAVGAAGIAYPFVKKYGGEITKDFPSMDLGGLNQAKDRIVNSVTEHVRGLRQGAAQLQRQAEDMFSGYRTSALRPTGAIDRMGAEPVQPSAFDPREIRNPAFDPRALDEPVVENPNRIISAAERSRILQPLNNDLEEHTRAMGGEVNRLLGDLREVGDAPNVSRISQAGRQPEPTYRLGDVQQELAKKTQLLNEDKARPGPSTGRPIRGPAQDPDVPTVSIPKGERVARVADRRLARGIEDPGVTKPTIQDPFQIGVEARAPEDWSARLVKNPPQAVGDYDPFQDIIDQQRFREERAAMTRDRVRAAKGRAEPQQTTDYDPVQPTEKAHLRSIKPKEEPLEAQAGPAEEVARPPPAIPASELTGGISPASLPEGAGFSRGGLKITAKREPAFGGTTNSQGYKVLDQHIGSIYGDSITPDRARQIIERLTRKGFASTNVVLGIGSYTYQYNTRDTFGFAMKATYVEVNGEGREIFKDPITDDGTKKSAKGLLHVSKNPETEELELTDMVSRKTEAEGELKTIFKDGKFYNRITLTEVRNKISNLITKPELIK